MEIRQSAVKSIIPAKNQLHSGRITGAQDSKDGSEVKQHYLSKDTKQVNPTANPPTIKRIAEALNRPESKQPISTFVNKIHSYEAINPRHLNALNAYTEELNQPLQEQLSMLAGIDFYV